MLERLGRLVYRLRWAVLVAWTCLVVGSLFIAPRVTSVLQAGGYTIGNSESIVAYNTLHQAYGYRALTFVVVFDAPAGRHSELMPVARAFRRQPTERFGRSLSVDPPRWSPDHAIVFERINSTP